MQTGRPFDIASDVIMAVRKKHERGKIKFQVGDITEELPAADLLISKDVCSSPASCRAIGSEPPADKVAGELNEERKD